MGDRKEINELLAAFYAGTTTREEEVRLKAFFDDADLSERWHADRDIFRALYDPADIALPEGLSDRLEQVLDRYIGAPHRPRKQPSRIRRLYVAVGSVAAAALLCVTLFFIGEHRQPAPVTADTFTDPHEAELVATEALALVSMHLNKGLSPFEKARKNMDKTNEVLEKLNLK